MRTRTVKLPPLVADRVDRALLVATRLWDDQCYGPRPHHSATPDPVVPRCWRGRNRLAAGDRPLGLLVQGHVGEADGPFWECESCGFRFDAMHADTGGSRSFADRRRRAAAHVQIHLQRWFREGGRNAV